MRPRTLATPGILLATLVPATAQNPAAFDAPVVELNSLGRFERVLDYDGNGIPDAVQCWWTDDDLDRITITFVTNDGQGYLTYPTFGWFVDLPFPPPPPEDLVSRSVVGNFDADAGEDAAFGFDSILTVLTDIQLGTPLTVFEIDLVEPVVGLGAGHLDGDADLDLATCAGGVLRVHANDGDGSSFTEVASAAVPFSALELEVADLDGLPGDDVALLLPERLRLYPVAGGVIGAPVILPHAVQNKPALATGDVDGDGDLDLVVFGMDGYQLFRRSGPGSFVAEPFTAGGPATDLADVDGDGDLDGVCCGSGLPDPVSEHNNVASNFEIAINDGTGAFAPAFQIPSLGSHRIAGVADLDGDGDADLVGGRCVYYSKGAITGPIDGLPLPAGTRLAEQATRDADDDGDLDYEVGLGTRLTNLGDGTAVVSGEIVEGAPAGLTYRGPGYPADWDGDGDVDLLVSTRDAGGAFVSMRLLASTGGGTYVDAGEALAAGTYVKLHLSPADVDADFDDPRYAFPADVDSDGDLDLVANSMHPGFDLEVARWFMWMNDGTGHFTAGEASGPGFFFDVSQFALAVGNIDGDSHLDVLLGNSYRIANGDGTYAPLTGLPGLSGGAGYTLFFDRVGGSDIDGDGDLDVLTLSSISSGGQLGIFRNDGTGTFTFERLGYLDTGDLLPVTTGVRRGIFAVDADGDGIEEILIGPTRDTYQNQASEYDQRLSYHLFEWDDSLAEWSWPSTRYLLEPHAIADVDGDGDPDLLGEAIWRNRRIEGAAAGRIHQYGQGNAGSGGAVPVLGAKGPVSTGETVEIRYRNGVGGGISIVMLALQPASFPGVPSPQATLLVDPTTLVFFQVPTDGPPGVTGAGGWTASILVSPSLAGLAFYHQAFSIDFGAPGLFAMSNGLEIVYGG